MTLGLSSIVILCLVFFVIALVYSSVGFGGGSSYLAILTLFALSFYTIRSTALLCNIVVVSGSLYWFIKKGYFYGKAFFPFVLTSIPMAYLGATFRLSEQWFFIVLGFALIISSLFLIWQTNFRNDITNEKKHPSYIFYLLGILIGFISGLVGIGGGIFLAPLLYHLGWGSSKKIAALACFFIFVNSIAGVIGLAVKETLEISYSLTLPLLICVFLGGQIGIRLSLQKLSAIMLKRVTAILVFIVGARTLLVNGLELL